MTDQWPDSLVGTVLGERFELQGVIGAGGMGVVFDAVQKSLGRSVAIKMLRPELVEDPTNSERFHREASLAANAGTTGVVDIIDLATDRIHGPFMVMERLRGKNLVEILQQGRLEVLGALWMATELLDVLTVVHAQGIVHRDLKPPNVFVHVDSTGEEQIKVVDFGIAKVDKQVLTLSGQLVGTPRYMSPEQALGETVDTRTDIYATGLLLYAALTGLPPYATLPNAEVISRVHQGPPSLRTLRPDLDPQLLEMVDKALQPNPKDRFQSADSMATALRALTIDGQPASTLLDSVRLLSDAQREEAGRVSTFPSERPGSPHSARPAQAAATRARHGSTSPQRAKLPINRSVYVVAVIFVLVVLCVGAAAVVMLLR